MSTTRENREWELAEWSLCYHASQPLAAVLSVGGKLVDQASRQDDLAAARRAVALAPTEAHFCAASRRLAEAELRARWLH